MEHVPESEACCGNLATAYSGAWRLDDAQRAVERALALDPTNAINLRIREEIEALSRRNRTLVAAFRAELRETLGMAPEG